MKLKLTTLLALTLFTSAVRAAEQPPVSVAVYDFVTTGEATQSFESKATNWNVSKWNAWRESIHDFGSKITALVTADLSTEPGLALVERAELTKALNEQAFGLSGMVSSDAATKIGQMTGAKILVAGQVFVTENGELTVVASVIGTETGRLYAVKAEGAAGDLTRLADGLAKKISNTISSQATNLVVITESRDQQIDRIIKNLKGTNRPVVSVNVLMLRPDAHTHSAASEDEFGAILLKAGFTVVDQNSAQKPDLEITGVANYDQGAKHGILSTCSGETELKIQERLSGRIIAFDRQPCSVTDPSERAANRAVQARAMDQLAERILPLLAK